MNLEFDVHMNAGVLYDYMLRHTYTGTAGILGSAAGALGVVAGAVTHYPLYWIFGVVILAYQPVSLWLRAKQQALQPVFKEPLHYKMTDEGVEDMYKAVSTGRSVILYTDRIHASIFPRKDLGERQAEVIAAICAHMPAKKVQIRF